MIWADLAPYWTAAMVILANLIVCVVVVQILAARDEHQ